MLRKAKNHRKRWRSRAASLQLDRLKSLIVTTLLTLLLMGQPTHSTFTHLTNHAVGASFSSVGGHIHTPNICTNDLIFEGTSVLCRWNNIDSGDVLQIDLGSAKNVGAVIFVIHTDERDSAVSEDVANFMLSAGSSTSYFSNTLCNDGEVVRNNGIVNCVVANARYIHMVSQTNDIKMEFSEIYVLEEPDYAQKYLSSITTTGTLMSNPLSDAIGLVSDIDDLGDVHIQYPAGMLMLDRRIELTLTKEIPGANLFLLQTSVSNQRFQVKADVEGSLGSFNGVCSGTGYGLYDTPKDKECSDSSKKFIIFDYSVDESLSSDFYIDMIGVMSQSGQTCYVSFEAIFDSTTVALDYIVASGDYLHSVSTTSSYKPSWCTFSSSESYLFFSDQACTTPFSVPSITLSFDHSSGQLTVNSADTSLAGTSQVVYMTKDVNGAATDLYEPIAVTIDFTHPCMDATIDPLAVLTAQQAYYVDQVEVTVTIPYDTVSQAQSNIDYCGTKVLASEDTTSAVSPAPYVAIGTQTSSAVQLFLQAPDASYVGRHTVQLSISLADYATVTPVTTTFDVVFCPLSVDTARFLITVQASNLSFDFDIDTSTYTPPSLTMSTYDFDNSEGCFEYVSYRVHNMSGCCDDVGVTNVTPYDDSTGVLSRTYIHSSPNSYSYEIFVTLGDPLDATTQEEFKLDGFTVDIVSPCEVQPTVFSQTTSVFAFQQDLDTATESYAIEAPNSVATQYSDVDYCGPRTTTYVVKDTTDTVTYAAVTDTTASGAFFDFNVDSPPADVLPGDVVFTISSFLTDFPTVTTTFEVTITFECPSSTPSILTGTPVDFSSLVVVYDLSTGGPQFTPSTQTSIDRTGCALYDSPTVYDVTDPGSEFVETMVTYDPSSTELTINVVDPTALPSMHLVTRTYESRVSLTDMSSLPLAGTIQTIDTFQVQFEFLSRDASIDCPTTTLVQSSYSGSTNLQVVLMDPELVIAFPDSEDTFSQLYYQFDFCGDRLHTFTDFGTSTVNSNIMQITTSPSTGIAEIRINSDDDSMLGTWSLTQTTTLPDYTSVDAVTFDWIVEIVCPYPNFYQGTTVTALSYSHEFYQLAPETHIVNKFFRITTDPSCQTVTQSVIESDTGLEVSIITVSRYDGEIYVDVQDRSLIHLVGLTVDYKIRFTDAINGDQWDVEDFSVTYTGPPNSECYYTTLQLPETEIFYYKFGSGIALSDLQIDPTNAEAATLGDPFYCGDYTVTVTDLLGVPVPVFVATDNPNSTWQFSYDGSGLAESTIGNVQNFRVHFGLVDFPNVATIEADLLLDVYCPSDGTLISPATTTIIYDMPATLLVYNVTSLASLEADLPTYQIDVLFDVQCQNVTKSYIMDSATHTEVPFITLLEETNQLSIYHEDADELLQSTTHTYLWLIDLTDGQIGAELVSFQVEFISTNHLPHFAPPLGGLIQIYKKELEESWVFILPDFFDENVTDEVTLSVDMTAVDGFISFDEDMKAFEIENLADPELPLGTYKVIITLSDGTDSPTFNVSIVIRDVGEEEDPEPEEPSSDEDSEDVEEDTSEDSEAIIIVENTFVFDWRSAFLKKEEELRASGSLVNLIPPKPTLSYIKETGEVQITFNQQMQIVPSLDMIKDGKIEINGSTYKVFDIAVIPAEGQDPSNVSFDWAISEITEKSMRLKLTFNSAVYVSAQMEPDILEIVFRDRYLFVGLNDLAISIKPFSPVNRRLAESTRKMSTDQYSFDEEQAEAGEFIILRKQLPQQLQLGGAEEQIQEAFSSASEASQVALASNVVVNVALAASLNQLWSMINTQQLIVMMPLFNISMPANAAVFFRHIMEIAAFDFVDFGDIIHETFEIEETEPIDVNFDSIGFESQYFLVNMGTLVVFYLIYLILALLVPILACCGRCSRYLGQKAVNLEKKIYWNYFITLMNESFMILIVCVFINIKIFSLETPGLAFMSIMCAILLFLSFFMPVFFLRRLFANSDKLKTKEWRVRYGELYPELNMKNGRTMLWVPGFFLLRRIMLGIAVCVVGRFLIWQIFLLTAQIIIQIIIIGGNTYATRAKRVGEYFNEVMLMQVMYTIFIFTPWVDDVIIKFQIGYLTCLLVIIHLVVNFFLIFRISFYSCGIGCRRRRIIKKFKKERKERQAYLEDTKNKRWGLRKEKRKESCQFKLAIANAELNKHPKLTPEDISGVAAKKESSGSFIPQTGLNQLILKKTKTVTFSDQIIQLMDNQVVNQELFHAQKHLQLLKKKQAEDSDSTSLEQEAQKHLILLKKKQAKNSDLTSLEKEAIQCYRSETKSIPFLNINVAPRKNVIFNDSSLNDTANVSAAHAAKAIPQKRLLFGKQMQAADALFNQTSPRLIDEIDQVFQGKPKESPRFAKPTDQRLPEEEADDYNIGYVPAIVSLRAKGLAPQAPAAASQSDQPPRRIMSNFDSLFQRVD